MPICTAPAPSLRAQVCGTRDFALATVASHFGMAPEAVAAAAKKRGCWEGNVGGIWLTCKSLASLEAWPAACTWE